MCNYSVLVPSFGTHYAAKTTTICIQTTSRIVINDARVGNLGIRFCKNVVVFAGLIKKEERKRDRENSNS